MRTISLALAALVVALVAASGAPAGAAPGQYIVVAKAGVDATALAREHAHADGALVSHVYSHALHGYAAQLSAAGLAAVQADARVAYVAEDRPVTIAAPAPAAQVLPTGVDRIDGDLSSARSGDGSGATNINVAVLDTGIDIHHPDLNVVGGVSCINSAAFDDGNGHGTHVSGTIAAKDDGIGVVGVAPGARLWAVQVLNSAGSGTFASVICGVDWVTAHAAELGIKVANMSLGGGGSDDGNCGLTNHDPFHQAICNSVAAGVTYVVAAGNSADDEGRHVPAAYDEALTVTAVADFDGKPGGLGSPTCRADEDDSNANFSNFAVSAADQAHTIAGPGVCILSTWKNGGYNTISGTSMATPHLAGTAALCIASGRCKGKPASIIKQLRNDAAAFNNANPGYGFVGDPLRPIAGKYFGFLVRAGLY
jgi:subtilisin family serine protease